MHRILHGLALAALTLNPCGLLAQDGPAVMGAGFSNPAVVRIAPGQVMKLFVNDVKTLLPYSGGTPIRVVRATTIPLPTSLAGFAVRIRQGNRVYLAPIFSVEQVPVCSYEMVDINPPATPNCWVTALMIQVPFEILSQLEFPNADATTTSVIVREGDRDSIASAVLPYPENIHIRTTCDTQPGIPVGRSDGNCEPVVTHADGTLVSRSSPARAGETIVVYAFGLGRTVPAVSAGEATPSPAPVVSSLSPKNIGVTVRYDFRPNAGASRPYTDDGLEFAGLTPGQIGLYQVNVRLPATFPAVEACGNDSIVNPTVRSNLTISLGAGSSFDGTGICVQSGGQEPVTE